ncbi:MAG: type IV-A pilus assembly ATPase PilB, partial [Gammaproteobacteria bacterium]|nr:type IV-A pilus assembly ATPase PilB [Gammaproteobacteria bacterium]
PYAAASVHLIVAQRLARRLCPECRQPYSPGEAALREQGVGEDILPAGTRLYRPGDRGACRHCADGYRGRVGVFQVMPISPALRQLILDGAPIAAIETQAHGENIATLRASGLRKLRDGVTSLEEINRVTAAGTGPG